jgi:hypothetical protein
MIVTHILRGMLTTVLLLGLANLAFAQYPGGGGGGGSSGTGSYTPRTYSAKGKIIGGVVAGAAAGGGLLYWKLHNRSKLQGCVSGAGDKLVSDKDNQTYNLTNKEGGTLKPGERVELRGKKTKNDSGEQVFKVSKYSKDLGSCKATTAENR